MAKMFAACAAASALAVLGVAPANAGSHDAFTVWISSVNYEPYDRAGMLTVIGYASFVDSQCRTVSQCESVVHALFTLRVGYGRYGRIAGRADVAARQSPWLNVRLRGIACGSIPRHKTRPYTVVLDAQAPGGLVRTASRTISVPSCRL
jgi:hypothetical protein